MESLLGRKHTRAPIVERCQLEAILVGFSSAIDEKKLVVVVSANVAQSLSETYLEGIDDRIAIESQLFKLVSHLFDIMRVRMADANHGMSTVEVEVFVAFIIPDMAPLSLDDVYVE